MYWVYITCRKYHIPILFLFLFLNSYVLQAQPIADKVAQNLEIISKTFQSCIRRTRILMGFFDIYVVLIVNPMSRILVRWNFLAIISRFCATLSAIGCTVLHVLLCCRHSTTTSLCVIWAISNIVYVWRIVFVLCFVVYTYTYTEITVLHVLQTLRNHVIMCNMGQYITHRQYSRSRISVCDSYCVYVRIHIRMSSKHRVTCAANTPEVTVL